MSDKLSAVNVDRTHPPCPVSHPEPQGATAMGTVCQQEGGDWLCKAQNHPVRGIPPEVFALPSPRGPAPSNVFLANGS